MIARTPLGPHRIQPRASASYPQPSRLGAGWVELIVCCLIVLFIYSGAVTYFGADQNVLKPIYFHALIIMAGLAFAWPTFSNVEYRKRVLPITVVILIYIALMIGQAVFIPRIDYRLVYERAIFCLVLISAAIFFVRVKSPDLVLWVLRITVVASCALIALEQIFDFNIYPDNTYWGRASGLVGNPNAAALYIAGCLPLLLLRVSRTWALFFIAATVVGVFATFSRGGMLLWMAAVFLFYMIPADGKFTARLMLRLLVFVILAVAMILNYETFVKAFVVIADPILTDNTRNRLLTTQDGAARERLAVLRAGWESFLTAPIFGQGVGSAWNWQTRSSVHNQLVLVLVEQGVIGFAWLCSFLYVLARNRWPIGIWLVAVFLVALPFTHNFFDTTLSSVLIALYMMAAVGRSPSPPGGRLIQARKRPPPIQWRR